MSRPITAFSMLTITVIGIQICVIKQEFQIV